MAAPLVAIGSAPASASTCFNWQSSQPALNSDASTLNSTNAISACDVWAVGWTDSSQGHQPLIEHWTGGASWSTIPSPVPGGSTNASLTSRLQAPIQELRTPCPA
jgi:hypothetical protein